MLPLLTSFVLYPYSFPAAAKEPDLAAWLSRTSAEVLIFPPVFFPSEPFLHKKPARTGTVSPKQQASVWWLRDALSLGRLHHSSRPTAGVSKGPNSGAEAAKLPA